MWRRPALLVSHPGHELLVHHWLERARPLVLILTDGSGRAGWPRIEQSARLLATTGATCGSVFGDLSDRALYRRVLSRDVAWLEALAERLAEACLAGRVDGLVTDPLEGINPGHDVCHELAGLVAEVVERRTGRTLPRFDFPLYVRSAGEPDAGPGVRRLPLDDDAFARKHAAAGGYTALAEEVAFQLECFGADAFRTEWLRPIVTRHRPPHDPPVYEHYAEQLVATGVYGEVLRYRTHVAPLVDAVRERLEAA